MVIMGGAIAQLPDGHGNVTPNAEFNFWVDPEAARIVLRSGIPTWLSPLNVSRQTALTRTWYAAMVEIDTPITRLIKQRLGPRYEQNPDRRDLMYDQVAVASLIDPTLVTTRELFVDVDVHDGINYGVSVGGAEPWPGAEGAQQVQGAARSRLGSVHPVVRRAGDPADGGSTLNGIPCPHRRRRERQRRPHNVRGRISPARRNRVCQALRPRVRREGRQSGCRRAAVRRRSRNGGARRDDLFGPATIDHLESLGVGVAHVRRVPGVSSGVAPIFVDASRRAIG